jgi:polyhydroxyalkanoate synthesis regulator phasin
MVDGGKLTSAEKTEVLEHLTHNIASCTEEIEKCKAAGENAKKIEKLNEKKAAIVERKNAVNAVAPITHRLKHSDEIQKLEMQVLALHALEEKGRSCSLTIADLKLLENKSTLESQVLLGFLARIRISILRFGICIFCFPRLRRCKAVAEDGFCPMRNSSQWQILTSTKPKRSMRPKPKSRPAEALPKSLRVLVVGLAEPLKLQQLLQPVENIRPARLMLGARLGSRKLSLNRPRKPVAEPRVPLLQHSEMTIAMEMTAIDKLLISC